MPGAGDLRQVLTIQTPKQQRDSFGAVSQVLVNGARIRGKVEQLGGDESFSQGGGLTPIVRYRVTVRAQRGLSPLQWLLWNDRFGQAHELDIQTIQDPDGRGRYFELHCIERVGQTPTVI